MSAPVAATCAAAPAAPPPAASSSLADREAQAALIEAEQALAPVLGEEEPPSVLLPAYAENAAFLPKLRSLAARYRALRRCRGDGNCFYRALLVSLGERFVRAGVGAGAGAEAPMRRLYDGVLAASAAALARLTGELGYSDYTVGGFAEAFGEWLASLAAPGATVEAAVHAYVRDANTSWWSIYWLRMLCSAELQAHADEYLPFILGASSHDSIKAFVGAEVERAAEDADQVQIIALCRALRVRVRIAYLDASPGDMQLLTLPADDGDEPIVAELLYRPGHYDILIS